MRAEAILAGTLLVATALGSEAREAGGPLRVCADPNNLPFSNAAGEGFENALAALVAGALDTTVSYTWWAQRRGFIRNTLEAGRCDLVMGVPAGLERVETTRPYYRSSYVFVHRASVQPALHSMLDPRLRKLALGVHLTGDDGANPPPVHALGQLGIVDNVVGYMVHGDYRRASPAARPIEAVAAGTLDVAAVWGPIGGYFAQRTEPALAVSPITDTGRFAPLPFAFEIAMGVRKGDTAFRDTLDAVLERQRDDVQALLRRFGVPLAGDARAELGLR